MSEVWTLERRDTAREQVRQWHGTPHADRLAIKGVGVDCIQLVNAVLAACGVVEPTTFAGYDLQDGVFGPSERLTKAVQHCCHVEVCGKMNPQFGDIAIFRTGRFSAHCAFYCDGELWHSLADRRVTRSNYDEWIIEIDHLLRFTDIGFKKSPQEAAKL